MHIIESLVMLLSLPACVKFEPQSCPKNLVSRQIPLIRKRKVMRVFVQSQSFNPRNSIVHRIPRADFAREFCFCRNVREKRQANWGFVATRLEFQLQQPRRFRLWRVTENGNHSCASRSQGLTVGLDLAKVALNPAPSRMCRVAQAIYL